MIKKLLKIYALIICLTMTLALFFVTIRAYDISTDLWLLKYKYSHKLQTFSSNKEFLNSLNDKEKKLYINSTDEQINKERNQRKDNYIAYIKREAVVKSVYLSGWLFITIIFLLIHWRLYKKSSLE